MGNMDGFKRIVRLNGDGVGLDTKACKKWETNHENCTGCKFELGCAKVVTLGLLSLSGRSDLGEEVED